MNTEKQLLLQTALQYALAVADKSPAEVATAESRLQSAALRYAEAAKQEKAKELKP